MRLYAVLRYVAFSFFLNAVFLSLSAIVSLIYSDEAFIPLFYSAVITALFGLFPVIFIPPIVQIFNKEGLLIVVLSWLLSCLIGIVPYILWGGEFTLVNAWFESVSGYTTTGSSILTNVEALPPGLLFWRASTHFIGGIGIIIFALAVLPAMGKSEMVLYRSEISSLGRQNFQYRTRKAVKILAGVYLGLTFFNVIGLLLAGMNLFDAVTHAFATIATGGFSTKNTSIAFYQSVPIEVISIVFMILAGMHFGFLFSVFVERKANFWKSTVVKYYLAMLGTGILLVAQNIQHEQGIDWWTALRQAAFNVTAVGTSTGLASTDTTIWPAFAQMILIFFALQCACSGSTSGGIKTDRMVILFKAAGQKIKKLMHTHAVVRIKIDDMQIDDEVVSESTLFIPVYLASVFLSTLLLAFLGMDNLSAFSGTVAAMGNVGPGLGTVGSMANFGHIPEAGKWILGIVMLLGRLEIWALLIFFLPRQWKKSVTY
jgi:trk system potassium uptake protein TrkH